MYVTQFEKYKLKFERRVLFIRRIDKWAVNESWSGHKLRDMTPYFSCHTVPLLGFAIHCQ